MTERRLLWYLGGVTVLMLVFALVVCIIQALEDRVTPAHCDRIWVGMTESEVRAILGRPADHRLGGGSMPVWVGKRWVILVGLSDRGAVTDKNCYEADDVWE